MSDKIKNYFKNILIKNDNIIKTSNLFNFELPRSLYKTFLKQTEKIKKILTPKTR